MLVNGVGWFQHLDQPVGCIIDLTSSTVAHRPIDPRDDRQVILSHLAEARRYVRRLGAKHFPPEQICYLPTQWSQERKYAGALSALKKWGLSVGGK